MYRPSRTEPWMMPLAALLVIGVSALSGCSPARTRHPTPAAPATTPSDGTGLAGIGDTGTSPTAPSAPPSPTASPVLADGRSAAYLKSVDVQARTVTFDLIVLLEGADATKEWLKTHPNEPEGPPEGYLIVNDNKRLRTLPMSAQVAVKVVDLNASDPSIPKPLKLADLPAHLTRERNAQLPYWLTVQHGQVTLVEEEYLA